MAAPAAPAEARKGTRILGVTLGHSQNMIFLTQVAFFCLYGGCTTFEGVYSNRPSATSTTFDNLDGLAGGAGFLYHVFISIFVFLGFGLLYIQNHKSPLQALGFTLSIAATTVEWAILLIGFWDNGKLTRTGAVSGWPPIPLNMTILLNALYIACTIVVSYGALVGRVSFGQAYAIAFFEVFFATANFKIMEELRVNDYGGTMFVHFFGATFGLFASMVIRTAPVNFTTNANRARDVSVFGLLGTIVLFILYPVFNTGNLGAVIARNLNNVAAPALLALNFRGYFNTVAAMASSVASSYMLSRANSENGDKFTIWQIQTSAVAGGAAIAATAPMLRNPWGALMTGSIVGILATLSQTLVAPLLAKIRMFDATGVFASHWVPGFVGIFASAIAVARVTGDEEFVGAQVSSFVLDGRSSTQQGGTQCAFGLITFGIALIGGIFTGLIVNLPIFEPKDTTSLFDEEEFAGLTGAQGAPAVQPAAAKVVEPAPAAAAPAAEPEAAAVAPKVDAAAEPAATA